MSIEMGIDQRVLHSYVAMQNLAQGRSINDIAAEIGRSRFATARMVRRAREFGLIEVHSTLTDTVDIDLSTALSQTYGLRSALVVATPSPRVEDIRAAIATIAARFLIENVEEDDVLGFTPGRTLVAASRLVDSLAWSDVVQLTGVGAPRLEDGVEAISNFGRAAGGTTYALYAPLLIPDPGARQILQHPAIQRTLDRFPHLTKAFMTIGGWPKASLLARQLTDLGKIEEFERAGVVAEVGTMLLDSQGRSVRGAEELFVGISEEQLRAIPMRVAIGGGEGKEHAVVATLRSNVADVVITDVRCARAALSPETLASKDEGGPSRMGRQD